MIIKIIGCANAFSERNFNQRILVEEHSVKMDGFVGPVHVGQEFEV